VSEALRSVAGYLRRRRARALVAAAASLAGAVVLWVLAVSPEPPPRAKSPALGAVPEAPLPLRYEEDVPRRNPGPRGNRPARREKPKRSRPARATADRPRQRLAPGHRPAFGDAIARISISAIGVRAPVIRLGKNRDDTLQVPGSASQAGWWSGGAKAGRRGTAVIVGHVAANGGPAVFYRLRQLRPGDRVRVVHRDGSRASFSVTERHSYSKRNFPTERVYSRTPKPTLRLITCGGSFDASRGHYRDNVVVFARAD